VKNGEMRSKIKVVAAVVSAGFALAALGVVSAFAQTTPDYTGVATGLGTGVSSAQGGINAIVPLLFGIVAFIAVARLAMRWLRSSVGGR